VKVKSCRRCNLLDIYLNSQSRHNSDARSRWGKEAPDNATQPRDYSTRKSLCGNGSAVNPLKWLELLQDEPQIRNLESLKQRETGCNEKAEPPKGARLFAFPELSANSA